MPAETNSSPLAGEGGARAEGAGGRGAGGDRRQKTVAEATAREKLMKARAKTMRSGPTEAERKLWRILRAKRLEGLKWRHQVEFDDLYIADFVCFAHRLIVEADGSQHSKNERDLVRNQWFVAQGFRVLRFWNNDILLNPDGVVDTILHAVEFSCAADAARPSPPPLPREGGGEKFGASNA